jgi:hypothetical protein
MNSIVKSIVTGDVDKRSMSIGALQLALDAMEAYLETPNVKPLLFQSAAWESEYSTSKIDEHFVSIPYFDEKGYLGEESQGNPFSGKILVSNRASITIVDKDDNEIIIFKDFAVSCGKNGIEVIQHMRSRLKTLCNPVDNAELVKQQRQDAVQILSAVAIEHGACPEQMDKIFIYPPYPEHPNAHISSCELSKPYRAALSDSNLEAYLGNIWPIIDEIKISTWFPINYSSDTPPRDIVYCVFHEGESLPGHLLDAKAAHVIYEGLPLEVRESIEGKPRLTLDHPSYSDTVQFLRPHDIDLLEEVAEFCRDALASRSPSLTAVADERQLARSILHNVPLPPAIAQILGQEDEQKLTVALRFVYHPDGWFFAVNRDGSFETDMFSIRIPIEIPSIDPSTALQAAIRFVTSPELIYRLLIETIYLIKRMPEKGEIYDKNLGEAAEVFRAVVANLAPDIPDDEIRWAVLNHPKGRLVVSKNNQKGSRRIFQIDPKVWDSFSGLNLPKHEVCILKGNDPYSLSIDLTMPLVIHSKLSSSASLIDIMKRLNTMSRLDEVFSLCEDESLFDDS